MDKQSLEVKDSPEGLFFYPKIETIAGLEIAELTLWMGRGACFGWDLEERARFQKYLEEQRARLMGGFALG